MDMVKSDGDAYPIKFVPFTVENEHYWSQKNKNHGENWHLWFTPILGEYCKIIFVLQDV